MTQVPWFEMSVRSALLVLALAGCGPAKPPVEPIVLTADPPDGAASIEDNAAQTELQRGIAYIKNEKYDEAKSHLREAMKAKPNAEASYYIGVACEKLSDRPGAEAAYKAALDLDGKLVEAAANLSALYLDDPARPALAIAVLEPAVKNVDDVRLHQNLALAYSLAKNVDGASHEYDVALAKAEDPQLRFAYGVMLVGANLPDKAAVQLRKAVDGAKGDAALIVTVGRLLGQAKAFGDCVKAFDKAIQIKATDPEWFVRRGVCKHEINDEPGAMGDYEAAIKVDPKFATAHYYLGLALVGQKKRQSALAELDRAAKLGGDTPIGKAAKEKYKDLEKKK